jgi:hypothetical protein
MTEKQVRKRHRLADSVWEQLGENEELVEKIELEKTRRIRDGSSKRERRAHTVRPFPWPHLDLQRPQRRLQQAPFPRRCHCSAGTNDSLSLPEVWTSRRLGSAPVSRDSPAKSTYPAASNAPCDDLRVQIMPKPFTTPRL